MGRINLKARNQDEAQAIVKCLILIGNEDDEIRSASLDPDTHYPLFYALEPGNSRMLWGKPSGKYVSAAQFCSAVAYNVFEEKMEIIEEHLRVMKKEAITLGIATLFLVAVLSFEIYSFIVK